MQHISPLTPCLVRG